MTFKKTLLMTAAAVMVSATGAIAENNGEMNSVQDNAIQNQESAPMSNTSDAQSSMSSSTGTESVASVDSSTIENAQSSLKSEGYTVSVDGVWGPQTAAALREFQQERGLSATGELNTETLAALEIQR